MHHELAERELEGWSGRLVAGSGLRFADRGMHGLKGVPDEWRLLAVDQARAP